jgi:hypothetical protein
MAGTAGTASRFAASSAQALDREIQAVRAELARHDEMHRDELDRDVRGRGWGPGRFRTALRESVEEDAARRISPEIYRPGTNGKPARRLVGRRPSRFRS